MSYTTENEKKNSLSFLDVKIIDEDKIFTTSVNLPLVGFVHILTIFYHLPITVVLFTHSLFDAFKIAQAGLNFTLN